MSPKAFAGLAAATAVAVTAAAVSVALQPDYRKPDSDGRRLFPGLLDRVNEVASIRIVHGKTKLTLRRKGDGWVLAESDGYPASRAKVRQAVIGLARLSLLEPKTRKKERYGKLEVRDPGSVGAKSKRLTIFGQGETVLADVIVGRTTYPQGTSNGTGAYVRKPGDAQAWLARGRLELGVEPRDWLDRGLIDLDRKRLASVVVRHPDGDMVRVSRADAKKPRFKVTNLPPKTKLKSKTEADDYAGVLTGFELEDARKAEVVPFPPDATVRADFATLDGLRVRISLTEREGENWVKLSASAEPSAAAEAKKEGKKGGKSVAEEAQKLNARWAGWAYRIADYKADRLKKRLKDLIEETKPAS